MAERIEGGVAKRKSRRAATVADPRGTLRAESVLAWIEAFHARTGRWPHALSGDVPEALGETWSSVDQALRNGARGLRGGSSLSRFVRSHFKVRNKFQPTRLSADDVLAWAEAHRARTGRWPQSSSGPIPESPGETWVRVDNALRYSRRGFRRRSSLSQFLAERRGVRGPGESPALTIEQILAWADLHRERTGEWPTFRTPGVREARGERWRRIDAALRSGERGLPGGTTLERLLAGREASFQPGKLRPLRIDQIGRHVAAYHERYGEWPTGASGPVDGAPDDTWVDIDRALRRGLRGLPGGQSLAEVRPADSRRDDQGAFAPALQGLQRLEAKKRLSESLIRGWALAHRQRHGAWPHVLSGAVDEAPAETWESLDLLLFAGGRGLPGRSSLANLLHTHARK